MWVPCLCDERQWVSLSLMAPSGIPGDLTDISSLTKNRGSAWWTVYFPWSCGIEIGSFVGKLESKESFAKGDSSKDSTEGSNQGELRRLAGPQGATGQDPCLQGASKVPLSFWEQHLSPSRLSLKNLEVLAEKVGTLGLQGRLNRTLWVPYHLLKPTCNTALLHLWFCLGQWVLKE